MGFPGEGMKSFYRNSVRDVIRYFGKYHKGKFKIYNLCDDDFINTNKTNLPIDMNQKEKEKYGVSQSSIPVGYFPMMDHNPAQLKMIFYLCLDALVYLSHDVENVVAIHCKAGKGRTGLVIACYMMFMEGCSDAYEAVNLFNFRRTWDMKGMKIPS
jgi:phosphatidylinositol-3,4,5-trisphosphate 3-phosphatase/dual-specificity protein phosphatase PTEN